MKKLLFYIFLIVLTFVGVLFAYHSDYLFSGRIIPPQILVENCEEVKKEIDKYDWDKETALAIAKAESKCNPEAKGDTELVFSENGREYGYSVGVFQIRILPGREKCDNFDIKTNVECAYELYLKNQNFNDWSMYLNGNYKNFVWHSPF